ncbi:hypothetical protein B0T10DRAFT_536780 [Thelonectria olida]|uniref:Fungal N-terminal domain-containing protein n=1 Tax=Thelonectria olida TaxID=1576542 RepID=A0A9P8WBY7_9HYPO|nr:hypothetical protein B0T10DRAFT_536780 [Thelonectria olida]
MADPLSVAGLGIGVVSLGLQVSGAIMAYIDALNCRDKDIASVKQQNSSLRKTLQIIETSLSQFHLIADLTVCRQSTTSRENKFKNHGKKLLYPFSRPKAEKLEARLGTEKLATLEATSHNISASLLAVQSNVSAMNGPLQGIHSTVSGFETRSDTLETLLSQLIVPRPAENENENSQGVTYLKFYLDLLCSRHWPAGGEAWLLKGHLRGYRSPARPRSNETLLAIDHGTEKFDDNVSTYIGRSSSCCCRYPRGLQRKNVIWGSLPFSFDTATEQHLPGCPAAELSFTMLWGAGGSSLSPNFTYYPTVDSETAPTFRILSLLERFRFGGLGYVLWRENLIPAAVYAILTLFRAQKASPRAVEADNRSLVNHLARRTSSQADAKADFCPLLELLECLIVNKAPAKDYNLSGQ